MYLLTDKLNMYQAVHAACIQHQAEWEHLPDFAAAFGYFSSGLSRLEQAVYLHDMLMLGITPSRDQLLRQIIEQAELITHTLRAFATATGDALLYKKVDFPKSAFLQHGNRHLVSLAGSIAEAAAEHCTSLKNHETWQQHVDKLQGLQQQLAAAIDSSLAEDDTIPLLITGIDPLLKELTSISESLHLGIHILTIPKTITEK